ncbi:MAG: hypothetical protein GY839_10300 [candidate division Zixibacteria bacterium]|nr:hypothetical protein [candidate division Zixibacteria bacterium]
MMRKTLYFVILVSFIFTSAASAITIHVPADYISIQDAVNGSVDGDTVLVAPGLYNEHIRFFGRAIVLKSEAGAEATIIEKVYEQWSLIYVYDGETQTTIIDGFTLRNASSGAIKCVGSSPTIQNCIIENCTIFPPEFDYFGGGITIRDSNGWARIKNNIIRFNDATHSYGIIGGGILINDSYAIIDSNIIYGNIANYGGAIDCHGGSVIIKHNMIYDNQAEITGGAIMIRDISNSAIINNTITDNNSLETSGGIIIYESIDLEIKNNIIANNNLNSIRAEYSHEIHFGYNCVFGHEDSLFYGFLPEVGNITDDPRFWDIPNDDYALHRYSPCINAGDPTSPHDNDGSIADMGAITFDPTDHLLNFSLLAPVDDSICANPPEFVWHSSADTDSGYPVFYRLYISGDPEFVSPDSSVELTDTVYSYPDSLIRSLDYSWHVKAYSYHHDSVFSDETWNFYLDGIPSMPIVEAPENGELVDSTTQLFWEVSIDPDPMDSLTYSAQIDDDPNFDSPEIDVSGISDIGLILDGVATVRLGDMPGFENLQDDQTYFWRVRGDDRYGLHSDFTDGSNFFHVSDRFPGSYGYLPGDVNMASGAWPPSVIGSDVTYLVNYFRGFPNCPPCPVDNLWQSADANGDCNILGSDVTKLVNYFRGTSNIQYCPYHSTAWPTSENLPAEQPSGWPNCEE